MNLVEALGSNVQSSCGTMSWFVVSLMILGLWKYDRCLLDRLERYLWATSKSFGWSLFKLWAEYRDRNEMIKDGYHVDSVFLYEHHSATYSRKVDVLRIFRNAIVNETFTNKKSIPFSQFLELCSDPESNFQVNSELTYELEVNYTLDRKQFKIIYSTDDNNNVRFPVYSEKEIAKAGNNNSIISASIIRRESDQAGIEIDDELLKYAGPLGNFYGNTEFVVKRSWLGFSGIDENAKIKIMDMNGNELVIKDTDQYLELKD